MEIQHQYFAGINAARTIRTLDSSDEVIIISKDEKVYSRCMLHFVIGGKRDIQGISFIGDDFFKENNVKWIKGISAKSKENGEYVYSA